MSHKEVHAVGSKADRGTQNRGRVNKKNKEKEEEKERPFHWGVFSRVWHRKSIPKTIKVTL